MKNNLIFLYLILFLSSCSKEELDPIIIDPEPPKLSDYSKSWDL